MATFALVFNGAIVQLAPATFPVAPALTFTGNLSAVVPAPQVGWTAVETGGVFTFTAPAAPTPPPPSPASALSAFFSGGITVTSAATPALNGVYGLTMDDQANIANEALFITQFGEFTTGAATNLVWFLPNGSFVTFPTTTEFLAFVKAVGQLGAAAKVAAATGAALPSATVSIP